MNVFTLSNAQARRIFLDRHALHETPKGPTRRADVHAMITRLGFVQLDSINTVARAHDLILHSRMPQYRSADLWRLLQKDRAVFEHWTHDAAIIPMAFYPYWRLRRQRDAERLRARWRTNRTEGFEPQLKSVLRHIRTHGPSTSSDVGRDEAKSAGGWWDWHPSKTALEYLWRAGTLAVSHRSGFQKHYDLTERVIAADLRAPENAPGEADTIAWCCNEALARLGFATAGELAAFWDHIRLAEAQAWITQALAKGTLMPVNVTCADGTVRPAYARPDLASDPKMDAAPCARLRVLSPFDPALRDRKRAARLFGFDYRIEVFVPEAKRTYGYYVFPLLEGDRLVGRIDMKAFRKEDILQVRALWPEPGVRWGKTRVAALEKALHRLSPLAGVTQVRFDRDWLRVPIKAH